MRKLLMLFLLIMQCSFGTEDYYAFQNNQQREQFESLTAGLRCLVCQNQNIAESNAGLAADLREQVYQRIRQGQTNQEIMDYLVARYGNYILYNPPLRKETIILWSLPFLLLCLGIGYLIFYVRRERASC